MFNYQKKFLFITFISFLSLNLNAIDFNTLRIHTIENSKLLKISKLNIDISKSELDTINSERYPTLTIGISTERSKGLNNDITNSSYVGDNSVSSSSLYKNYAYLSLNYSVFDFGRLYYKNKAQSFNIETKKNEYCLEQNSISQKLLDTYYNTKLSQIKNEYLQHILKYSNKLYQYYKRLHTVGNIQKSDVVSNAIQVANIYNEISLNNKNLIENFEKLSNISNFNFKSNDNLVSLSILKENITKEFKDTNLAKKYLNEINNKQAQINLIQAQHYPMVNAFGKYDFYGYDKDNFTSSFDNFEENSYKYGLNISWTIFDGYKIKSQEKKAMLELVQLKLKYEQAKNDFNTELNTLEKTHKFYKKIMEKNAKVLNLSNDNVNIALRLNTIGEIDKSIELNSLIKKLQAESEYKQARETIAYKMMKKEIMLNGDEECIVH